MEGPDPMLPEIDMCPACGYSWVTLRKEELASLRSRLAKAEKVLDIEHLAAVFHNAWWHWSKTVAEGGLSADRLERWRSYWVPYADLPESAKELDRDWGRTALADWEKRDE